MFKKIQSLVLTLLFFAIPSFALDPETEEGYIFDNIPGTTMMHTAPWINSHFNDVSNQIENINGEIEVIDQRLDGHDSDIENLNNTVSNHYSQMTNEFTNVWISVDGLDKAINTESNRIDNIEKNLNSVSNTVDSNYSYMTNSFTNLWNAITNMNTNFDGSVSNIYKAINTESNRIDNIETTVIPAINEELESHGQKLISLQTNLDYVVTNDIAEINSRLDSHDSAISDLWISLTFVSNNVNSNYSLITNLTDIVASNHSFTTNVLTNLWIAIDDINTVKIPEINEELASVKTNVESITTNLDYLITNTIPEITNNFGISIIGAETADSGYETNKNISTVLFDKDSGFTVITNEMGEKAVQISLGSAWTTLIPDIEKINPETGEPYPNLKPSGEETLKIKIIETNQTGTFWDYSNTNKNEKTFYIGINKDIGGQTPYEDVYTTDEIVVSGIPYPLGKYTNGSVIPSNTSLQTIFGNMFKKAIPPSYTNPVFSTETIGFAKNTTYEYGKVLYNTSVKSTIVTNDSGAVQYYTLKIPNMWILTNETDATTTTFTFFDENPHYLTNVLSFEAKVYYGEGPTKTNTEGQLDPENKILEGSLINTFAETPSRYLYYGTFSTEIPITYYYDVLSLPSSNFVTSVSSIVIPLKKGTKQTVFALPQPVTVTSMNFVNNFVNESITNSPNMTISSIPGVICRNGYDGDEDGGKTYRVYNYVSPVATAEDNVDSIHVTIRR